MPQATGFSSPAAGFSIPNAASPSFESLPSFIPEPPKGLSSDEAEPGVLSIPGLSPGPISQNPQGDEAGPGAKRLAPGRIGQGSEVASQFARETSQSSPEASQASGEASQMPDGAFQSAHGAAESPASEAQSAHGPSRSQDGERPSPIALPGAAPLGPRRASQDASQDCSQGGSQNSFQGGSHDGSQDGTLEAAQGASQGPAQELELGAGSFGRRYRPLESGKMADSKLKASGLDEATKLSKLSQIKKSAEEYEGMLIAEMIKSMRQSPFAKTPGSETYSEIAEKPFTAALTAAGGLGLSQLIITQVAAQEGLGETLAAHPEAMGPHFRQRLSPSQMSKSGFTWRTPEAGSEAATENAAPSSAASSPEDG